MVLPKLCWQSARRSKRTQICTTLIALGLATHDIVTRGWDGGKTSLLFPAIAGAWYVTRRGVRRKIEASADRDQDRS